MYQQTNSNTLMPKFTPVVSKATIKNIYRNIQLKYDLQQWFVGIKLH